MGRSVSIFEKDGKLGSLLAARLQEEGAEVFITADEEELRKKVSGLSTNVVILDLVSYPGDREALVASVARSAHAARIMAVKNPRMSAEEMEVLKHRGVSLFMNPVTNFQEILFVINFLLFPSFKKTRESIRAIVSLPVSFEGEGVAGNGRTFSLSHGGLFVQTNREAAEGQRLVFNLQIDPEKAPLKPAGRVRWLNRFGREHRKSYPIGFAAAFEGLNSDLEKTIDEYVKTELRRRYNISDSLLR